MVWNYWTRGMYNSEGKLESDGAMDYNYKCEGGYPQDE